MASALRSQLSPLMDKLKALEAEIETRSARLHAPGQPGLQGSLTDAQGFPRGDIDVPAVRADRHHIICLTNDHKKLMGQIQELMLQLHAAERESRAASAPAAGTAISNGQHAAAASQLTEEHEDKRQKLEQLSIQQDAPNGAGVQAMEEDAAPSSTTAAAAAAEVAAGSTAAAADRPGAQLQPFAVIDEVTEGSPAAVAGLQLGDLMCRFGGVTATSQGGVLQQVAAELAAREGQEVEAVLLRQGQQVVLRLVPQRWAGRGLLGCHLRPLA